MGLFEGFFAAPQATTTSPTTPPAAPPGHPAAAGSQVGTPPVSPLEGAPVTTPPVAVVDETPKTLDDFYKIMQKSQHGAGDSEQASKPLDLRTLADNREAITKVASTRNFLSDAPKEVLERAEQGEASAFIELIGLATQAAYAQGLQDTTRLAGQGIAASQSALPSAVQSQLSEAMRKQAMDAAVPPDAHPAAGMFLTAVAEQLTRAAPTLTPDAAMRLAQGMLRDMTNSFSPKKDAGRESKSSNWAKWFGAEQPS
jgi:hypothetical protein